MGILFQSVIDQSLPYLEKICSRYTVTDKDVGVVTAADSKFFTGLQLLYTSLKHKVNFCVFDIGLSDHQIKWCKDNDIIVKQQSNSVPDKFKENSQYWYWWNKPYYMVQSQFRYTVWIDSDVIVKDGLQYVVDYVKKRPFFVQHSAWENYVPINGTTEKFYEHFPLHSRPTKRDCINSGILAFDMDRDQWLFEKWINMITEVLEKGLRDDIGIFHDERCLNHIIHECDLVDDICRLTEYNKLILSYETTQQIGRHDIVRDRIKGNMDRVPMSYRPKDFFRQIRKRDDKIMHFCDTPKPWKYWGKCPKWNIAPKSSEYINGN